MNSIGISFASDAVGSKAPNFWQTQTQAEKRHGLKKTGHQEQVTHCKIILYHCKHTMEMKRFSCAQHQQGVVTS
jgi:hypothetical protein